MSDFYNKLLREKALERRLGWVLFPLRDRGGTRIKCDTTEPERFLREYSQ